MKDTGTVLCSLIISSDLDSLVRFLFIWSIVGRASAGCSSIGRGIFCPEASGIRLYVSLTCGSRDRGSVNREPVERTPRGELSRAIRMWLGDGFAAERYVGLSLSLPLAACPQRIYRRF